MMREGADTWPPFIYDADYAPAGLPWEERDNLKTWGWKRRPSIHLPRKGSRILLEIESVRVERLQAISEEDAIAEGIDELSAIFRVRRWRDYAQRSSEGDLGEVDGFTRAAASYSTLWESINGAGSWAANPWVWCVSFRRITP